MSEPRMEPATLEHSTGRQVQGWADRAAFDAGEPYVRVVFEQTGGVTEVYRSKVLGFAARQGKHTGQHLQGCVACYGHVAREIARQAVLDAWRSGSPAEERAHLYTAWPALAEALDAALLAE